MPDTRHLLKHIGSMDEAERTQALVWLAAASRTDREALAEALDAADSPFYDADLAHLLDDQYGADAAAVLDDLPAMSILGGSHEWDDLRTELAERQKTC